jgi:hypothetical protein
MTLTEVIAELKQGRKPALLPAENVEGTDFNEEGVAMRAALKARGWPYGYALARHLVPRHTLLAAAQAAHAEVYGRRADTLETDKV